ncbi:hypothetical protein ACSBLW_10445 [Thioclava sp. FR2]|uniref:hypothetical protein n=1 Tax=Thioclava sp. FR2 TaxID=3445780 RepID=UPI003EBACA93
MGFSYSGFAGARSAIDERGAFSANIGDNMQSLAVRHLYRTLGIPDERILRVDRDTLATYDGPPVVLPMNGCFYDWHFPLSPKITPLFIGFQARQAAMSAVRSHLFGQGVIGCRDEHTAILLRAEGIEADVTGCLTFSLPQRSVTPKHRRILIVHGSGSGALPGVALKKMPRHLLMRADFISQRREVVTWPLSPDQMDEQEKVAQALLHDYHQTARMVVTPLHHVAAPCMAAGIPVIVIRRDWDERFSFMGKLIPIHLEPFFEDVDWSPKPIDLTQIKAAQLARLRSLLTPWL